MERSTICTFCCKDNPSEDEFLSIPLSVDGKQKCDVESVLMDFLADHEMSGDDQLYCTKCGAKRNMKTRNNITKWPDILTLQLKRIERAQVRTGLLNSFRKKQCNVKIPSNFKVPTANYELYAIIHHHGTLRGGHYDADIKDERGIWYNFNDEVVTKVHNTKSAWTKSSRQAYLLMYRKASEFSSKMFKLRLQKEFQYLNEEISPGERQKLNDVFIKCHITDKPHSHMSDKRNITCRDFFNIRTVLMKGEAGIGKTVTVQKFILDWAEEKSNQNIKYIFLIPFQKLNIIRETVKECSFMDLLQRCFENTEHEKPTDSDRIMLIFDGLNEFKLSLDFKNTKLITDINDPASVTDLLINLIKGNLLPNAQIWITSRPVAANQIPAEYIDRVTEIQGFNEEQKEQYFRKNISDQKKANEVISHIKKSINSMCFLPDYCRIIAEIPEEMIRTDQTDYSKTLTQMYGRLLLVQTEPIQDRKGTIIALGKIAFDLLVNGSSFFSDEHLKKYKICVGSVKANSSIIKRIEDNSRHQSFCFMNHRTQEFLAALYVTDVINRGDPLHLRDLSCLNLCFGEQSFTNYNSLQNMMNIALQKQMDLFFCFLLGLTLESSQRDLKDLLTQRRRSSSSSQEIIRHIKSMIMNSSPDDADKRNLLFDALKELDDRYLIQQIKTQLKSGLTLSPAKFLERMTKFCNLEDFPDKLTSSSEQKVRPVVRTSRKHDFREKDSAGLRPNPSNKSKQYPSRRTDRTPHESIAITCV